MELRVAKELLHIQRWLSVVASVVARGKHDHRQRPALRMEDGPLEVLGQAARPKRSGPPVRGVRGARDV